VTDTVTGLIMRKYVGRCLFTAGTGLMTVWSCAHPATPLKSALGGTRSRCLFVIAVLISTIGMAIVDPLGASSTSSTILTAGYVNLSSSADGSIDSAFNAGGVGPNSDVLAVAMQPDGRIVISGFFTGYNGDFAASDYVMRLNADGTRDTKFNAGGAGANTTVYAVAVQPDGKILIAGQFTSYNGDAAASDYVMRLNADGTRDTTFNAGGSGANDYVWGFALQPDGKILVVGNFFTYNGNPASGRVMRLNTDGTLDKTFNAGGSGANGTVSAVAVQPDGKIVIAGLFTSYNGDAAASDYVMRLNSDGTRDPTFNPVGTGADHWVRALAIQSDGKILIGGDFTGYNGDAAASDHVMRLNSDGTRDTNFNAGGTGADAAANVIAVEPDGKIVIGGLFTVYNGDAGASNYLMRLNTDGKPDTTFNPGGAGANALVYGLAVQPDGRIVIGGQFTAYNGDFAAPAYVVRLLSTPPPTPVCSGVPDGIISWWPGEGNAQDIVGHYDGAQQNGATFGAGMVGQAFSLDGIDDAIVVNNDAALNPFSITVEAWVKPSSLPAGSIADVVTKWGFDATVDSYFLGLLNSGGVVKVLGGIGDGATGDSGFSGGTVTLNAWNHIAMTYDAASGLNRLYLNGASVSQRVRAHGIYPTTSRVFIGREDSNNHRFFSGLIDEPTIYSRALTDAEILAIYNAGGNGKCDSAPTISIDDVTAVEGNLVGPTAFTFTVTLSKPSALPITVNFATGDGTATTAGFDYESTSGTLTFNPGELSKTVVVRVFVDTDFEGAETFSVTLSQPTNVTIAKATGIGTILNDDEETSISIDDASVAEGNSGLTAASIVLRLSRPHDVPVSVDVTASNGTATSPFDYFGFYDEIEGLYVFTTTVTFGAGEVSHTVPFYVRGDTAVEPDETVNLTLSHPTQLSIRKGTAVLTIRGDDVQLIAIDDDYVVQQDSSLASGAVLVKDFPGVGAEIKELTNVNGTLFFSELGLWKSDGTPTGTIRLTPTGTSVKNLFALNGIVFFQGKDSVNGAQLWKSDGTVAGTQLVRPIGYFGPFPREMTSLNGRLFFVVTTYADAVSGVESGVEIWRSDGTAEGTVLVKGFPGGIPYELHLLSSGGRLFFDYGGFWTSDGTPEGTTQISDLRLINSGPTPATVDVAGETLFLANDSSFRHFGLWKTNGTPSGTILVKNLDTIAAVQDMVNVNGSVYFEPIVDTRVCDPNYFPICFVLSGGLTPELWKTDGTPTGTALVTSWGVGGGLAVRLVDFNGTLLFQRGVVSDSGIGFMEFWTSDGTSHGTNPITNFRLWQSPVDSTIVDGLQFFRGPDSINPPGYAVWKSDLTTAGTGPFAVADFMPQTLGKVPYPDGRLTNVNKVFFFPLLYVPPNALRNTLELWIAGDAKRLLGNDTILGHPTVTVSAASTPSHGTLLMAADGSFSYRPDAGFVGIDRFTYFFSGGGMTSNVATVTIHVTATGVTTDNDNDGIANDVDPAPSDAGNQTFSDGQAPLNGHTAGTILARNGKVVEVTDAVPNPGAGVGVSVSGAGAGSVQVQLAGKAETIALPNGLYVLTDPVATSTVAVTAGGPAQISAVLNGFPLVIVVGAGSSVTYTDTFGVGGILAGFAVNAVAGSVTLNGNLVSTPVALVGPPQTADACKENGWQTFNFPVSFKNQGDCVSYVNTINKPPRLVVPGQQRVEATGPSGRPARW
jgi:uncharacterized delta-60 repeat protein